MPRTSAIVDSRWPQILVRNLTLGNRMTPLPMNMKQFPRLMRGLRLLLPDTFDRIPSERQSEEHDEVIAKLIVQRHAEGSVLLSAGRFEINKSLLEEDQ